MREGVPWGREARGPGTSRSHWGADGPYNVKAAPGGWGAAFCGGAIGLGENAGSEWGGGPGQCVLDRRTKLTFRPWKPTK